MGVELMKEYGGIVMRGCQRLASRHPLLVFMSLVLIWIYRSFPALFALLVDALPVIASTTVLLGTLLFFGHSNAPEIQKEGKPYNHTIHNLKFRVMGETEIDCRGVKPERRGKACRKKARVVDEVSDSNMSSTPDKESISDYHSQRSVSSDDDDTVNLRHNSRPDEVKTNGGGETAHVKNMCLIPGYQGKSRSELSSPPFSHVTDHGDDEEEDYRSTIMPLMSHSTDQKIQEQGKETSLNTNSASTPEAVDSTSVHDFESDSDHKQDAQSPKSEHDAADSSVHDSNSDSTVSKPNEGLLPQTFNQVQQGLTSWFKWKA
ncbi:hypothetical protein L2E82_05058 [Cichorium intybus]|uniref:Uncharacterized protein n=1 Tax=Cichorium intybus TaxID=13427 RepID=A0ACB9H6I8_CICIN|nr:hypothetical protein L2E82_05058 [Cichorium intybus]